VIVRTARVEDAAAVHRLDQQLFGGDAWSAALVATALSGAGRHAVVAEEQDAVVGYAVTATAGDVVDLERIGVDPGHRRGGVGGRLLAGVLAEALAEAGGTDRMLLEVSAANQEALAFYAAAGFAEIDRRRRYYRDGTDAVVMRLPLGPSDGGSRDG
jgi:ribosomal-protein-alanine acetyltransferase